MKRRGVYILAAKRTPFGKFWGGLKHIEAPRLGAAAIRATLKEAGVEPSRIDGVYMGQVLTAGAGQNPARQAALYAGMPHTVPAETFNKVCASSLVALQHAARAIWLDEAKLMIAGGMESMSQAPFLLRRWDKRLGDIKLIDWFATCSVSHDEALLDSMIYDGLRDKYGPNMPHMGLLADRCAQTHGISREDQEAYAAESHRMALEARERGMLQNQIVKVKLRGPSAHRKELFAYDEGPREPNVEKMRGLPPVFSREGTITAATSSQISDGAGSLLLGDERSALKLGIQPLARIVAFATHAQEPEWYTTAPVGAIRKVLAKGGLRVGDIDRFEINEAFAVVPLYAMRELGIPRKNLNAWGGAIALGHPIGASGARITMNVVYQLLATGGHYGIAVACNGGGEAVALLVENVLAKK